MFLKFINTDILQILSKMQNFFIYIVYKTTIESILTFLC